MIAKSFELRDRGTFLPALAIQMSSSIPAELYLLKRVGYSGSAPHLILLGDLRGKGTFNYDPNAWGGYARRTWYHAHLHIADKFDDLPNGAVIDVEYLLGERAAPKVSERVTLLSGYKEVR